MAIPWIAILRDGLAIVVARAFAKWLFGLFDPGEGVLSALDFLVLAAAFGVVGCRSPAQRSARLGLTAACTWAIMVTVGLVRGATAPYGLDLVATLLAMLIGGGASFAIARPGGAAGTSAVAGGNPEEPPRS
jgi:hypothetical protein